MAEHTNICYRRLKPSDEHELIKFLYKQWHLSAKTPDITAAKLLARSYMYQLLSQQSRTYIAALDGRIIGVIMGRGNSGFRMTRSQSAVQTWRGNSSGPCAAHSPFALKPGRGNASGARAVCPQKPFFSWKLKTRQTAIRLLLTLTQNGRDCYDLLQCLNETDDTLLKNCASAFDGELVFFMVDEPYRGRGIGTSLLLLLHQYMRRAGVRKMYVLTDTGCDYDFYDRHKFSRLMKKSVELPSERLKFTCYMYEYSYQASPAR